MKRTIVVPTYWTWEGGGVKKGDLIFDHPTPLDQEGTLGRLLESLKKMEDGFELVLVVVPTNKAIAKAVEDKVKTLVKKYTKEFPIYFVGPSLLEKVWEKLPGSEKFFNLKGYSPVRNATLIASYALESDVVLMLDDDEVVEDPLLLRKAVEFLGEKFKEKEIGAKAGIYLYPGAEFRLRKKVPWWRKPFWDNQKPMNQAFEYLMSGERIKETPLAFGGNLVTHKKILEEGIPFDPWITRGEDIDWIINLKYMGYSVVFDREMGILHLPPPSFKPAWITLREDVKRFLYLKTKLKVYGLDPAHFDPYPGKFLKSDLRLRIIGTSLLLVLNELTNAKIYSAICGLSVMAEIFKKNIQKVKKFLRFWEDYKKFLPRFREKQIRKIFKEARL